MSHILDSRSFFNSTDKGQMFDDWLNAGLMEEHPDGNIRSVLGRGPYRLCDPPEDLVIIHQGQTYQANCKTTPEFLEAMHQLNEGIIPDRFTKGVRDGQTRHGQQRKRVVNGSLAAMRKLWNEAKTNESAYQHLRETVVQAYPDYEVEQLPKEKILWFVEQIIKTHEAKAN